MRQQTLREEAEATTAAIRSNIEAVSNLEDKFARDRTLADRIADGIGGFTGSLKFVALHAVVYGLWILINAGVIPFIRRFDPFPFILLSATVSVEAIFLSTFVLMKQNRMARRADLRAHLDLQINLLAEREMTLALNLLQNIAERLGAPLPGEEMRNLAKQTSVETLADEIKEKLPEE